MRSFPIRLVLFAALTILLGVFGLVPWLIREGYAGQSLPFINAVFSGRSVHDVDHYLQAWWSLVTIALPLAVVLSGLLYFARSFPDERRRAIRWLLQHHSESLRSARDVLWWAATIGLVGGIVQVGYLAIRQIVTRRPAAGFFWELAWMTPLASALATLVLAVGLLAVARAGRSHIGVRVATFVFTLPAMIGLVRSEGIPLYDYAEILVALGLTTVIARVIGARPVVIAWIRRRGPAFDLVAATVLIGFAVLRWPSVAEARHLSSVPGTQGAPNILLIILDTVRSDHLGLYGYARDTSPNLDAWAEDATVFERAYATAPWTLPSHASMFTGRYTHEVPTGPWTPLSDSIPTLADTLLARGFATAGFVANLGYTSPMSGLAHGFARYQAHRITFGRFIVSTWLSDMLSRPVRRVFPAVGPRRKVGGDVTTEFVDWLDEPRDRPFFAFLNYFDAHDPYVAPEPWMTKFGRGPDGSWAAFDQRWSGGEHSRGELPGWVDRYDGGIAYIDDQLGSVFRALEERGLAESTVVVVTADHGEHWGEHGLLRHTTSVYRPVVQVPLLVKGPGVTSRGRRVLRDVSLRDIPATVLSLLGDPELGGFPGAPFPGTGTYDENGPEKGGSPRLAELYPPINTLQRALVEDDWYYVWREDGSEELYALPNDTLDVAGTDEAAPVLARFRDRLEVLALPR